MNQIRIRVSDEVLADLNREASQNGTTLEDEAVLALERARIYKLVIDQDGVIDCVCANTSAWK